MIAPRPAAARAALQRVFTPLAIRHSSSAASIQDRPVFPCVEAHAAREVRARSSALPDFSRPGSASSSSNSARPSFPCVTAHAQRESRISSSGKPQLVTTHRPPVPSGPETGPEPPYARPNPTSYHTYHHSTPLELTYGSVLPEFDIAYETWGTLSPARDNVILLHTGLSASSHAASTPQNPAPGWWEKFIGPGKALDTDRFFVICTNVLGGCYGSTGPSSPLPPSALEGGASNGEIERYGTRFPIVSVFDMVRAQFHLLDSLGVEKLYASVGSSMGGMQSLAAGWLFSDRVGKIVTISGTARSSPGSIAMRFAQRSVLMADPNWNNGFYYDQSPPHTGMKLARQIATITYRSGPEWDLRFGRKLRDLSGQEGSVSSTIRQPALCPDFLIETYLDHQGEEFCLKYDANSLIYISKAMDLFDMTADAFESLQLLPSASSPSGSSSAMSSSSPSVVAAPTLLKSHLPPANPSPHLQSLATGLQPLRNIPTLILGVQSDLLFPVDQQREVADALRMAGNSEVSYYELGGVWGHDTFLLDVQNVGGAVRGFL